LPGTSRVKPILVRFGAEATVTCIFKPALADLFADSETLRGGGGASGGAGGLRGGFAGAAGCKRGRRLRERH
jgi:hypothetical protein